MSSARISYTTRLDTSQEAEIATLANVYSFVLRCGNNNARGVTSTKGDDAKGRSKDDSGARRSIPDR
jgi:hypothetical protein